MIRWGVFNQTPKAPIRRVVVKVTKIMVETMVITIEMAGMFEMETKTTTTASTGVTVVIEMIRVVPIFHLKIGKLFLGMVEVVWRELRICCRR